ncbi:transcriptional regulator, partial [Rhizobium ruizarguesonis]
SGLPPEYTEFANRLARRIRSLDSAEIGRLSALLENGGKGDGKAS